MRRLLNRFWFRWFVFAPLATFAILASVYTVAFYWVRSEGIAKRDPLVAKLDAEEPNWRTVPLTNERNAKLPPPEENAAELAWLAHQKIPKSVTKGWSNEGPLTDLKPAHLPLPLGARELRKERTQCREAIELARSIRDVPSGGFPLVFKEPNIYGTLLPKIQELRGTANLLWNDAALRAYDLDGKGALESSRAIFAIANGIGDEPFLISQLVRTAISNIAIGSTERALSWSECRDDEELAKLGAAIQREEQAPRLWFALQGERASLFRMLENLDNREVDLEGAFITRVRFQDRIRFELFERPHIPRRQAEILEGFRESIAAAKLPPGPQRTAKLGGPDQAGNKFFIDRDFQDDFLALKHLLPSMPKFCEYENRTVAVLRTASVAIACERHRLKTGSFPATLDELPKELLPAIPDDPYTGKPILYKRLKDGAVVYSVGKDLRDDGGKELNNHQAKATFDIGFRLWNKETRRQKPIPKEEKPESEVQIFGPGEEVKPSVTTPPPLAPIEKE